MNLSKIAVKRPVTTTMIICIVIAFGFLSINKLQLDMMPNMNIPIAIVMTSYSGTGPAEIENLITEPIEGAMGTVSGVKTVSSTSSYGSSIVILEFENNVNIDTAALDMREKIDQIKGFLPEDATDPMVMKIDIAMMNAMVIGVTSDDGNLVSLKRIVDDKVKNRLERQEGAASVDVSGGLAKEVQITLKQDKLRGYGISESAISQLIMAENRTTPTGSVKQGDKTLSLKVAGEFTTLDDIRNLPVTTPAGNVISLRDVADVAEVFPESSAYAIINGKPCVILQIQKQSTANSVELSEKIFNEIGRIEREMPGLHFTKLMDPADYINRSLGNVAESAVLGGLLAVLILYVFLQNVRSTLVVGVAIPVSIIATFVLMYYADITLNIMSLGGLTLGIGMLVDNSIVVMESIYRKIEEGEDRVTAAIDGAREVAMSVTASTLTTVAVFLPITFSGGLTAEIFNQLSLTITFSLMSSLFVALTFVPMACSLMLKPNVVQHVHRFVNPFTMLMDWIGKLLLGLEGSYKRLLSGALRHRRVTILLVMAFTIGTFMALPVIGMEFLPETDEGMIQINIEMPKGSVLEETRKVADLVAEAVGGAPEIEDMGEIVGGGMGMGFSSASTDTASVALILKPIEERARSAKEIVVEMNKQVENIPGAKIEVTASSMSMGSFGATGMQVQVRGDDLATLQDIAGDVAGIMAEVPGAYDVKTSVEDTSPQAVIRIDRNKAASYGIAGAQVAGVINTAVSGSKAGTYKIEGDEMDIRIRQDKQNFDYLTDVQNILIPSPYGMNVPVYELADITLENMPVSISRENQQKYVTVSSSLDVGVDINSASAAFEQKMAAYAMPDNYDWVFGGSTEQMAETFADLGLALIISLLVVYMIMAAEFESYIYPLIVMFSVPIALTGGIFGLFVTGQTFSITGFLGLIMLGGVVVNNAIVLVDYTNLLIRERQLTPLEALQTAGPVRMRPILMTTLTTVLGLIPMMLSNGSGAELMRGLATVVVFGLSLSTLVTLVFIPVIYLSYNSMVEKGRARREAKKAKKLAATGQ